MGGLVLLQFLSVHCAYFFWPILFFFFFTLAYRAGKNGRMKVVEVILREDVRKEPWQFNG